MILRSSRINFTKINKNLNFKCNEFSIIRYCLIKSDGSFLINRITLKLFNFNTVYI